MGRRPVIEEVRRFQPNILRTSLSANDEAELRQALEAKQEALTQAHA